MKLLETIYQGIDSLPSHYLSSSVFVVSTDILKTLMSELSSEHLTYDPCKPFKGKLLGFDLYVDSSRTGITFGDHKAYGIDQESLVIIDINH